MIIPDNELIAWFHHYVRNDALDYDKHLAFALDLGINRAEAKKLCYKIAFEIQKTKVIQIYFDKD